MTEKQSPKKTPSVRPISKKSALFKKYKLSGIVLGEGSFSEVRLGLSLKSFSPVAVKVIDKSKLSESDLAECRKELMILKYLALHPHPNIIELLDEFEDSTHLIFVFEQFDVDLYDYVKENKLSEAEVKPIVRQIVHAVRHLHRHKIAHCDIKPENVLICSKTNRVILTDFGFADFCFNRKLTRYCGSVGYVSPEVVCHHPYDTRVDTWALGVLTFVLLTRRFPFYDKDESVELDKIKIGKFEFLPREEKLSRTVKSFIRALLVPESKRPRNADAVITLPWLNSPQPSLSFGS